MRPKGVKPNYRLPKIFCISAAACFMLKLPTVFDAEESTPRIDPGGISPPVATP
jgi:hypothetical protein